MSANVVFTYGDSMEGSTSQLLYRYFIHLSILWKFSLEILNIQRIFMIFFGDCSHHFLQMIYLELITPD